MSEQNPKKKAGKPKMTPEQKKARQEMLANETIEQRTKRVLNPRLKTLFHTFDMLISSVGSPRYKLTAEQQDKITENLNNRYQQLQAIFDKKQKKETAQEDLI